LVFLAKLSFFAYFFKKDTKVTAKKCFFNKDFILFFVIGASGFVLPFFALILLEVRCLYDGLRDGFP